MSSAPGQPSDGVSLDSVLLHHDPPDLPLLYLVLPQSKWLLGPSSMLTSVLFLCQIVNEYERAVIFRLGRIKKGGAKGPGLRFIIPCIDTFRFRILT